jgi:uncharacterized protein YgbK (DUF1537 family)
MERHPLTPMTDSDLVRWLQAQATRRVGLLSAAQMSHGPRGIAESLAELKAEGVALVICDALEDRHLLDLARAVAGMPLVTGSSGIAMGLPQAYREAGELAAWTAGADLPGAGGPIAVLAGSCSPATRRQVVHFQQRHPARALDVRAAVRGEAEATRAIAWAEAALRQGAAMIYSTVAPEELAAIQEDLGREAAAAAVERTMGAVARGLLALGVRRFAVAGGETAGAVVEALGVKGLCIGPAIDPGAPWTESIGEPKLALAFKPGNFGGEDFFERALAPRFGPRPEG